jgi:AcrR family transcriptional regulator
VGDGSDDGSGDGETPLLGNGRASEDDIAASGRARVLKATRGLLLERGPAGVTVGRVAARAGMSRSRFYNLFGGLEGCVETALGELADEWREALLRAFAGETHWREGVRVGLTEHAALASSYLDAPGMAPLAGTARAPVEGIREEHAARAVNGSLAALPRALRQPRSRILRACLRYIQAKPGASNTHVCAGIGGKSGSQVSTALKCLHELGLLDKQEGSRGRSPNAWTLSVSGEQALLALDAHAL